MELARVIGRCVATIKYETLEVVRLLVIQPEDAQVDAVGHHQLLELAALGDGPGALEALPEEARQRAVGDGGAPGGTLGLVAGVSRTCMMSVSMKTKSSGDGVQVQHRRGAGT